MTHALATGKTIASKYPSLGSAVVTGRVPLGRMLGLVVGEAGAGKSFLLQSNPNAFIINLDGTPAVCPTSEAVMWPVPGADGRPTDERGNPIVLTWKLVEEKQKQLIELAKNNQPRPETVVIDTLGAALRLLRPYVASLYGREQFHEIDGRLGWERLFDTLIEYGATLRRHGYGVYYIAHLSRKHIPLSEQQHVEEYKILISDGLYARMFPMFDLVIPITTTWDVREEVNEVEVKIGDRVIKKNNVVSKKVREHFATFSNPKLEGIAKVRTLQPMETLKLPNNGAWAALQAAYEAANAPR